MIAGGVKAGDPEPIKFDHLRPINGSQLNICEFILLLNCALSASTMSAAARTIKVLLLEKIHADAERMFLKEGFTVVRHDELSPQALIEVGKKVCVPTRAICGLAHCACWAFYQMYKKGLTDRQMIMARISWFAICDIVTAFIHSFDMLLGLSPFLPPFFCFCHSLPFFPLLSLLSFAFPPSFLLCVSMWFW